MSNEEHGDIFPPIFSLGTSILHHHFVFWNGKSQKKRIGHELRCSEISPIHGPVFTSHTVQTDKLGLERKKNQNLTLLLFHFAILV